MLIVATNGPVYLTSPKRYSRNGAWCGSPRKIRRRRRFLLGQATGATGANVPAIVTQACGTSPNYCTWKSGANKQGGLEAFLTQAAQTRFIPDPSTQTAMAIFDASFNCATGTASTGPSAIQTGGKIISGAGAITTGAAIAAGAAAGSVVPVIGTILGAIGGLIAGLFGAGHAKAVAGEAQAICSAVPQVNAVLQQIDAGLAAGSITPAQAQSAYSQLQSQLTSALHQSTTYKTGDTLWAFNLALQVVIQARNADLAAGLLTGGGTIPTGAAAAIGAATGIPPLYLALGGLALLYFLL